MEQGEHRPPLEPSAGNWCAFVPRQIRWVLGTGQNEATDSRPDTSGGVLRQGS